MTTVDGKGMRIFAAWAGVAGLVCALPVQAGVVAFQNGETNPHLNWSIVSALSGSPSGSLLTGQSVGGHADAMVIQSTAEVLPAYDFAFNSSGLTGNYLNFGGAEIRSLSVELYASVDVGNSPGDNRLYMRAGGFEWFCDIGPRNTGWATVETNMRHADDEPGYPFGWYSETGRTSAQFYGDLASVDRIGVEFAYLPGLEGMSYGIDTFALNDAYVVPEPSTLGLLCAALAAIAARARFGQRLKIPGI